jgi:hypothetical protein
MIRKWDVYREQTWFYGVMDHRSPGHVSEVGYHSLLVAPAAKVCQGNRLSMGEAGFSGLILVAPGDCLLLARSHYQPQRSKLSTLLLLLHLAPKLLHTLIHTYRTRSIRACTSIASISPLGRAQTHKRALPQTDIIAL